MVWGGVCCGYGGGLSNVERILSADMLMNMGEMFCLWEHGWMCECVRKREGVCVHTGRVLWCEGV